MIDIEDQMFTRVANAIRETFPDAYVVGEYVPSPPSFPCVSFIEAHNKTYRKSRDSGSYENHIEVMYEVNIYSNKRNGKKRECREIGAIISNVMENLGFTRIAFMPIDNQDDTSIYRIVARYNAIVSKDEVIYRR